jgi:hypothetical protein
MSSSSHDKAGTLGLKHTKLGAEWVVLQTSRETLAGGPRHPECYRGVAPTVVGIC